MLLTTTTVVEGKPVRDYLGVVNGEAIIGANLEELASVHGIGEKTAHGIWDLARRPYR